MESGLEEIGTGKSLLPRKYLLLSLIITAIKKMIGTLQQHIQMVMMNVYNHRGTGRK